VAFNTLGELAGVLASLGTSSGVSELSPGTAGRGGEELDRFRDLLLLGGSYKGGREGGGPSNPLLD